MTINKMLEDFENAIKASDETKANHIKHILIHPNEGAYFAIYRHSSLNNQWYFDADKVFYNKFEAEKHRKAVERLCKKINSSFDKFDIRRIAVHETDITNYL